MYLSKSKYCEGFQCKKMLWLDENKPEVREDANNDSVLETGTEVGILAKKLFGDYIDISFNEDLKRMVEDTKKVMAENNNVNITEASFLYDNNFCSVDILRKKGSRYEIYEVKSSTEVTDIYIEDAAYQYYVLTSLGLDVDRVCIVHINNQYVRHGELDLNELFIIVDITNLVKEKVKEIRQRIDDINEYMKNSNEPEESIGIHCTKPYDCPYFAYCTRDLEKPNVFDIRGMRADTKFKYYHDGCYRFKDLLEMKLNKKYLEQIDFEVNNKEPKINKKEIKDFLDTITYPLYFLDFETFQQAIPMYDGVRPYSQIPFQYSLHYTDGVDLYHREFLGIPGKDPRRSLAESLVRDIPKDVCVLAYNMRFEKGVIRALAELFPDLRDH